MLPILVAGGGMGGLGAALALGRAGFPVRLFERNAEFRELGAGIHLGPNAFHMLDRLGIREDVVCLADQLRRCEGGIARASADHGELRAARRPRAGGGADFRQGLPRRWRTGGTARPVAGRARPGRNPRGNDLALEEATLAGDG